MMQNEQSRDNTDCKIPVSARNGVLVTGGSGFVGTHLLKALLKTPTVERIVVLDIVGPQVSDPRIVYIPCDLRTPIRADVKSFADISTCFHLAAVCKEPGFPWDEYYRTNDLGTRNLLQFLAEANIFNLIFTSTTMVFQAGEERHAEESLAAPDTAYGASKLLAEVHADAWRAADIRRRLRIVRPGVVFGLGEGANFTRLYRAIRNRLFVYVGRKDTIKGCVYVKDLVRLLCILASDTLERITYHAVYPDPHTIESICASFCRVYGLRRMIPVVPYRLALSAAYGFELMGQLGLRSSIHHRRIEKLYRSTNASAEPARLLGLPWHDLDAAIDDWRDECDGRALY